MTIIWSLLIIAVSLFAYIRLAPSDPERWHKVPQVSGDKTGSNYATRLVPTGKDGLRMLLAVAEQDPRTQVLAGTVEEGMITFITRSRTMGFPDFTTALQDGEDLKIWARSRFGRRDFGVNAERVDRWIQALTR